MKGQDKKEFKQKLAQLIADQAAKIQELDSRVRRVSFTPGDTSLVVFVREEYGLTEAFAISVKEVR